MIKILICDDHAIVRQGLRQIVEDCHDILIAGEAESGEAALRMINRDDYDVVLLDIAMDGIGGIETLAEMRYQKPDLAVLILSMYPEDQYAIRVLRAGAAGYMTKKSAPDELLQAIRCVAAGKRYITASVGEHLVSSLNADENTLPHHTLSDREYQVFIQLTQGKGIGQVAEDLHISVKTVSTYKSRVLEKLDASNLADLIRYALEHHLIP